MWRLNMLLTIIEFQTAARRWCLEKASILRTSNYSFFKVFLFFWFFFLLKGNFSSDDHHSAHRHKSNPFQTDLHQLTIIKNYLFKFIFSASFERIELMQLFASTAESLNGKCWSRIKVEAIQRQTERQTRKSLRWVSKNRPLLRPSIDQRRTAKRVWRSVFS